MGEGDDSGEGLGLGSMVGEELGVGEGDGSGVALGVGDGEGEGSGVEEGVGVGVGAGELTETVKIGPYHPAQKPLSIPDIVIVT